MTEEVSDSKSNLQVVQDNSEEQTDKNCSSEVPLLLPDASDNTLTVDNSNKPSLTDTEKEGTNEAHASEENAVANNVVTAHTSSSETTTNHVEDVNEVQVDESNTNDDIQPVVNTVNLTAYREDANISTNSENSDSSDSDSSSTVSDDNENDDGSDNASLSEVCVKKRGKTARTKGEIGLEDLPPIEDLTITVEESKCKPIGSVFNVVDTMVVVQSFPNTPALDVDTVLFLDRGQRPLGKIFEVFGQTQEPLYCVRFNSRDHIKEKNITKEQVVYCAPQTEYTIYINTAELMKNKGSDASWTDNNEPPVSCLDFSDDEEEARAKHPKANTGSKRVNPSDNELFVKKMNQRNLELTAKRKKEDEAKQKRGGMMRRGVANPGNPTEMPNMTSQPCFSQYAAENYKLKTRTFSNSDPTRLGGNFHHNSNNTHTNNFDPTSQPINFLVGNYNTPANFTFPPQQFLCTSARQIRNVPPAAQNYLTVYSHPQMHTPVTMPPFSTFNSPNIPPMPTFPPQPPPPPSIHPPLPSAMHPSIPQFPNFNRMTTVSLPSSLPQPNFFPCTDVPAVRQQTFMTLNYRNRLATSFHPQFVLPPPPPPLPPTHQHHHSQQRDQIPRSDRRNPQSHQNNSYYPTSYNS